MTKKTINMLSDQNELKKQTQPPAFALTILSGVVVFILGLLSNLLAAWLQQDVWQNAFTPTRVGILILLSLVGAVCGAVLDRRLSSSTPIRDTPTGHEHLYLSGLYLWFSKLRSRGRGIRVQDTFSVGSEIDIDTKE
jgi:hypothetical protein